ncbi:cytochrome c-type biogenesis protein CcmF [Dyadobacter koreensis]|uniref:Cytochrome c-type biogenesis protein CcmF n=1 Tax=Dyadobacter koreensis TaxID=408657 RepID=A0A1H6T7M3_9BACT|nr:cytochrome c biogenesis protein CcsA [Dyadobacter koreensis]SEI76093.1 cytochrome c-type biogenesis protein CcmF [Dyadobacter koreensis]
MIHTTIGSAGHLLTIIAFASALLAVFAYFKAGLAGTPLNEVTSWKKYARVVFSIHAMAVIGIVFSLYWIIGNHYFEYHYAWKNSSLSLPTGYTISSFWQDQEGSFLLWIFWNVVLGSVLIFSNRSWEAPVMTIFALVQAFLTSMILGVVIPGLDLKIGSTPFLLMKEVMPDLPVYKMDPNFIAKDGNGLNPLLQNYWMVIHPPTLFLGFATTLIPFSFAIAGLWTKKIHEWVRPALPWALFSAMILGIGILMGAYWAYETLNFGSYWNWDPVENSSIVPWLILIAAIHTMIIARRNATALKTSFILAIATFILILYSTFMTRSGVLGNASVHSFTDLGLSGQLLIYLLTFTIVSIALLVYRWKELPSDEEEVSTYSQEFWIFIGATLLCLSGFQILATTSIPVYNKIAEAFGGVLNMALPADQVAHYNKFQLWFFSLIIVLTGIGQYFWWKRVGKDKLQVLYNPLLVALLISAAVITYQGVKEIQYIVLLTTSIFAIVSNGAILFQIVKGNYSLSGGAVTHIGVALMLLGILFSSAYTKVVSINNSGLMISRSAEFTNNDNKENKENITLWLNKPEKMGDYMLTWRDVRVEPRHIPGYIPKSWVDMIENDFHAVALRDIVVNDKKYNSKGDTIEIFPENFYYEIEYREPSGRVFNLFPRAQINPRMGLVSSPDIQREVDKDLYTYVSMVTNPTAEPVWSPTENFTISMRDTFFVNDYVAILDNVVRTEEVEGIKLGEGDAAVKAMIRVLDKDQEFVITPSFVIRDRLVARKPEVNKDLGFRVQFQEIDPSTGKFTFAVNTTQRDFIVMKATEKPLINILWLGTFVLVIGFIMATIRRFKDFIKMRDKENAGVLKPKKNRKPAAV